MEKTKTRTYYDALVKEGVSPKTARQAASTLSCEGYCGKRTERGSNQVLNAWEERMLNAE